MLTVLSLFRILKRLTLVHLAGDSDKGLAGLKAWWIFSQLCQLVSIKTFSHLANVASLGRHKEEERLKEKKEKCFFIDY